MSSDLLRRHVRAYHPEKKQLPSRKLQACSACHMRKERCEGGSPCKACQLRGAMCIPAGEEVESGQNIIDEVFRPSPTRLASRSLSAIPASGKPDGTLSNMPGPRWIADEYIDIYFDTFHPVWPFLHQSTFDVAKEPCVLVQSVVMIGLWLKGGPEARDASKEFHYKLCSAIRAQMVRGVT